MFVVSVQYAFATVNMKMRYIRNVQLHAIFVLLEVCLNKFGYLQF